MAETIEKTLYRVRYYLGHKRSDEYLTFFYAVDNADAQEQIAYKQRRMPGEMQVLSVTACPHGMTIRQSSMPGKITVCDGVAQEPAALQCARRAHV